MRRGFLYQTFLILLGFVSTVLFGVFIYRELFPEYRIYQNDYIALEKFRSSYTGEPPPEFKPGVKQIVIEREDRGPPVIDRCISCHVALDFPHFSPTKIAYDINGAMQLDAHGNPVQVPNENYVWTRLDERVAALTDAKVNEQLIKEGKQAEVDLRAAQADSLSLLKTAQDGDHVYDVTKVLRMHPLIGKETRPFEFHPVEEYGCVSCHNGNGRGLTTETAHGPVFDGQYPVEDVGHKPRFLESDPDNDPQFSKIFNEKPGEELLFQTTPIFVGGLIQARCMQCHLSSKNALKMSVDSTGIITNQRVRNSNAIENVFEREKSALSSLIALRTSIAHDGLKPTVDAWKKRSIDYTQTAEGLDAASNQLKYLQELDGKNDEQALKAINSKITAMTGSSALTQKLEESPDDIDAFIAKNSNSPDATGTLFAKAAAWNLEKEMIRHVKDTETSFKDAVNDQQFVSAVQSDIDELTRDYQNGQSLYISQACYACHRIAGFARGGVGPELTFKGSNYPWFIKESIVWPQADTPTSTMPNYRLDHEELEGLVTFLLGQTGKNKAVSEASYKAFVGEWERGRKQSWEKPVPAVKIHDLRYSMTVFATEGCAACHRLQGYTSNVGYTVEKNKPSFDKLYKEKEWFSSLFPEQATGQEIVSAINSKKAEIDARIASDVRQHSLLEEIDEHYPGQIEALYSPFKYASRAKNHEYTQRISQENDPEKKAALVKELQSWKERVKQVMMLFIQEYGLGRLVGPRPNWSGIYHTDEWLMEHFHNPSAHVPRSIMPLFPFDDSKFYALTYMLDALGIRNRDSVRQIWQNRGFNPELAFHIHCAQCHGDRRSGNGPVAEWLYPIPKNLRNADFLRNLTKEQAIASITHGVKGTPMPPWGEAVPDKDNGGIPVLNAQEIAELVNWLFADLPGNEVFKGASDVPKWHYTPQDAVDELNRESKGKLE